jgi:hypothetical protein
MLAIVKSLQEWDAELRSLKGFEVHTDHKNLEYFMTVRKLSERQMRWSLVLSRYNFQIIHIAGTANGRADALSRRDQDLPQDGSDERLQERNLQLIKPEWLCKNKMRVSALATLNRIRVAPVDVSAQHVGQEEQDKARRIREEQFLANAWPDAIRDDPEY